ncbi:hypothetical protein DFH08DRAFT_888644 [Mycena albidolilacea]|uniref:Uncharacterized protein n=1 Tax=Mycena albidolilacea TaxID=1033008 RepID=A0AAD6ZII8_9AGAR|nr:hypothetical protein DFH08DRAFT_888644 [Mycena albidolilacea]
MAPTGFESDRGSLGSVANMSWKEPLISAGEAKWVEIQPFLLSVGYPTMIPTGCLPGGTENINARAGAGRRMHRVYVRCEALDAIRIEDGRKVALKWMPADSKEFGCIEYLSNLRSDPRNRTIPVLQTCRAEFMEAMQQFLEGLAFYTI